MRFSFRSRLVLGFVLVIGAIGLSATVMGAYLIGQRFVRQAQAKVAQDINSARVMYEHEVEKIQDAVRMTANRFTVRGGIRTHDTALLRKALRQVRENEGFDLLTLTDPAGIVIVRSHEGAKAGDSEAHSVLVRRVLETRRAVAGTELLSAEELGRESEELEARARIALIPTPRARPTTKTELASGMVILAASPVVDEDGKLLGVLFGGRLINRRGELVDRIKETVYRGETHRGLEIGTATLFLGDTRVATTVHTKDGRRALGTRIQAEVGDQVLEQGRPWTERAFVVDGWYLTAYEPIRSLDAKVIGILYVGMREDKFVALKRQTVLAFLGVTLGGCALAGLIAFLLARSVLRPIRQLVLASRELSAGNFEYRVPEASRDEIGSLERAFNRMTEAIRERDREIRENAEAKIIRSANLASLGQLAASVAHEVNNPLAGILVYLRLMLKYMCQQPFPLERVAEMTGWLRTMESEGARCGRLVTGMLQLGRQPPMRIAVNDVNSLVTKSVVLLEHRFALSDVAVTRRLDDELPAVQCDAEQIQQTVMGLLLNASEAMPRGGTVTIATRHDPAGDGVQVSISDTGVGIPPEHRPRLFDAFFTTKGDGKGVGLGLSIAHAIVKRHGGRIEVESEVGRGSTFTVTLPVRHREEPEGDGPANGKER